MVRKKRGQVWVETITYTLIAFVLIGLVLAFVKPKVEEARDKALVDQSIQMLKDIDQIILETGENAAGNKRKIEITLKKGMLEINPTTNVFTFEVDSRYLYSEPGTSYQEGNLEILTEEKGKYNKVTITMTYSTEVYDFEVNGGETAKVISRSATPYDIFITNKGGTTAKTIDIEFD